MQVNRAYQMIIKAAVQLVIAQHEAATVIITAILPETAVQTSAKYVLQ